MQLHTKPNLNHVLYLHCVSSSRSVTSYFMSTINFEFESQFQFTVEVCEERIAAMPVKGDLPHQLYVGIDYDQVTDLDECLNYARDAHFDFLTAPLAVPDFERTEKDQKIDENPWTRSDLLLNSDTWRNAVFGKVSEWIDCDSTSSIVRKNSEAALLQELNWALHVGCYGALLPAPKHGLRCENYAMVLNKFLSRNTINNKLWLRVPLVCSVESPEGTQHTDGWEVYNKLRTLLDHNDNLHVSLQFTEELPDSPGMLDRWACEAVKVVELPCDIFLSNKKGYPVLSKKHRAFLEMLFDHKVQVFLSPGAHFEGIEIKQYLNYLARLFMQQPAYDGVQTFAEPFFDHLQEPLQPLADNLESATYEVFEQDPVKYVRYEEAVLACLRDKMAAEPKSDADDPMHPEVKSNPQKVYTIMVVGAGRGPLVVASRNAANRAGVAERTQIFAVEKNVNAVVTLRCRKLAEKWDNVTIVSHDMRTWEAPAKADIQVSELLGSFGDNELSPECLDGAQNFLAKDGVSIPQMYYSTIRPVSCIKLWKELRKHRDAAKFEMPYVVYFQEAWCPCQPQELFRFEHPNWELESNDRFGSLTFDSEESYLCTGL